jgi:hypothetical protein
MALSKPRFVSMGIRNRRVKTAQLRRNAIVQGIGTSQIAEGLAGCGFGRSEDDPSRFSPNLLCPASFPAIIRHNSRKENPTMAEKTKEEEVILAAVRRWLAAEKEAK